MATRREKQTHLPGAVEDFLRDFEWTWTKAAVFCLIFGFVLLITQAVIPSWFFYFADETLGWRPGTPPPLGLGNVLPSFVDAKMVVEAIVMGWVTVTVVAFLVGAVVLQNTRRKLRGHNLGRGGYRSAA
jgi:hypothetical protein